MTGRSQIGVSINPNTTELFGCVWGANKLKATGRSEGQSPRFFAEVFKLPCIVVIVQGSLRKIILRNKSFREQRT
jgi:hypothetical protein